MAFNEQAGIEVIKDELYEHEGQRNLFGKEFAKLYNSKDIPLLSRHEKLAVILLYLNNPDIQF